jgi:hypothetical protein
MWRTLMFIVWTGLLWLLWPRYRRDAQLAYAVLFIRWTLDVLPPGFERREFARWIRDDSWLPQSAKEAEDQLSR